MSMNHDCAALGIDRSLCPLHEGSIHDDAVSGRRVVTVELMYPSRGAATRTRPNPTDIEIGLLDVRADDGLRLHYDFDRDGWAIEQPWYEDVEIGPMTYDRVEHWVETGFFPSWALRGKNIEA